ncbi:threonine ammonia-lyase [soil metagenome]
MIGRATERNPTVQDVQAARQRISAAVRWTPLERSDYLSERCGADVLLKLECWQRTRSFKVRGAFNALGTLPAGDRSRGVVTASAGNHGQAVALAARAHDVPATIFVPANAPQIKQQRIRQLGAALNLDAPDYDEAERLAFEFAAQEGRPFVHAFSDAAVIAGQGTVGLEIIDDAPQVRDVIVPVGGGGLIAGVGLVLKAMQPHVRVIGVQSVETRAMYEAFRAGRVTDVPITPTLADGLAGCTDETAYGLARGVVDDIVLVEEQAIAHAIATLYARDGIVAEGAAATAVAAVLGGNVQLRGPAVLVVTGGNIDGAILAGILRRGHE